MSDLVRSAFRLSWAMSLFGARQATELAAKVMTARPPRTVSKAFDAVSEAAEETVGNSPDPRWASEWVDRAFDALDPALTTSREIASSSLLRGSLIALRETATVLERALPSEGRWIWSELRNKLEAFEGFQFADRILGVDELRESTFAEQVECVGAREQHQRLFLLEGLGFAFAEAAWEAGEPRDLLNREALAELSSDHWIPLHTGLGLSLARHVLPQIRDAVGAERQQALERFAELCSVNSRPGYGLATYEALGFIVRQLAPELVDSIARQLESHDAARHAAFWHGVGRALYFVASQAVPGTVGRALDKARAEAPDGVARWNALAGLAWAVTLINLRQPEVLAAVLEARELSDPEERALSAGIAGACLLWAEAVGQDESWQTLCAHQPPENLRERWQRTVSQPIVSALEAWRGSDDAPETLFFDLGGQA